MAKSDLRNKLLNLQEILDMVDEVVGYSSFDDHVIGETTWRKYVRLYNEFRKEEEKVKKVGQTKGSKYYLSDVEKVIQYNMKRIENNWFDKTTFVPKRRNVVTVPKNTSKENKELYRYLNSYLEPEERVDRTTFMEMVKNKRNEVPEFTKIPIVEIAKSINEERVEKHFNVFDTDDKYDFLKSPQIEKDLFLKLFDLDAYHSILEEVNDSERDRRYNRKLDYMINNPIVFLKEEHRKHIIALAKEKFWGEEGSAFLEGVAVCEYYEDFHGEDEDLIYNDIELGELHQGNEKYWRENNECKNELKIGDDDLLM